MMKKKIILANWKMKLNFQESHKVIDEFIKIHRPNDATEVVICPSFTVLEKASEKLADTGILLGAQNCFWEQAGAFTGEISPAFLKELGCRFVIVGHSERRSNLAETDEIIHQKVKAVLEEGLTPVICVGETFEERQDGNKDFVIMNEVTKAIEGIELKPADELIVAYEPVWVIGSGQAVEPEEAKHTHQVIRQVLIDHFEAGAVNERVRIIYGGSVDSTNIKNFFEAGNIEGALVGGASLDAHNFHELILAAGQI